METEQSKVESVDVKAIMRDIKIQSAFMERDESLDFEAIPTDARNLDALAHQWNVQAYRPLYHEDSFVGKIKHLFKRVARKCVWGFVSPIVEDQNRFNHTVYKAIEEVENFDLISAIYQQKQEQIERLLEQNRFLLQEVSSLQQRMAAMEKRQMEQNHS